MTDNDPPQSQEMARVARVERPIDFTQAVFNRAGMYTVNGTLEEAGAFLEGYYSGAVRHCRNFQTVPEWDYWWKFNKWLGVRIGLTESTGWASWSQMFRHLRTLYPVTSDGDAAAFAQLGAWYLEFLDSAAAH